MFLILSVLLICLFARKSSPCPSLSFLYGKELHDPSSFALASWQVPLVRDTTAEARRGGGGEKPGIAPHTFLHLLCGSTSSQLAPGPTVPALAPDPLLWFNSCQTAPSSRLWQHHVFSRSLLVLGTGFLLLLISRLFHHTGTVWLLCPTKTFYQFLVLKFPV